MCYLHYFCSCSILLKESRRLLPFAIASGLSPLFGSSVDTPLVVALLCPSIMQSGDFFVVEGSLFRNPLSIIKENTYFTNLRDYLK